MRTVLVSIILSLGGLIPSCDDPTPTPVPVPTHEADDHTDHLPLPDGDKLYGCASDMRPRNPHPGVNAPECVPINAK